MEKPEPITIIDEYGTTTVIEVPDTRSFEEVKDWKISEAAKLRDLFIVEGFYPKPFNVKVKLDEAAEARLTGAKAYLADNPEETIYWSLGAGNIIQLTRGIINAIANQAGAHVQRGFRIYGQICQLINSLTSIEALDELDIEALWLELQNEGQNG